MSFAITAAMAGISALTTGMQIKAQNEAAVAQQESIAATTRMNYMLKQQQEQELKAQAGMELTNEAIKRYQERGKIKAAQGESGVAGISPLRELSNTYLQQSLTAGSIVSQEEAKQRSLALENQSTYLQGLSQMNQLESQKTTGTDAFLSLASSAAQGALSGYSMGSALGTSTTAASGGIAKSGELTGGQLINNTTGESMWLTQDAAASVRGTAMDGFYFKNIQTVVPY